MAGIQTLVMMFCISPSYSLLAFILYSTSRSSKNNKKILLFMMLMMKKIIIKFIHNDNAFQNQLPVRIMRLLFSLALALASDNLDYSIYLLIEYNSHVLSLPGRCRAVEESRKQLHRKRK